MEQFQKILIVTMLFADVIINEISTTQLEISSSTQWLPVLKARNITKDWKVTKGKDDMLETASGRRDSTTLSKNERAAIDHDTDHISPNYFHHQPYYDTPPNIGARYEPLADTDGYYHTPYAPVGLAGYRPPYAPPPPPSYPEDSIRIELAFESLVIRCIVQEPLEHIVWTRFACPNDYFYGNGQPVAEGSVVHNTELYNVHIVGDKGEIASELLLKTALDPSTSGLYICEAWPHYQKPGDGYGQHFQPPMYPSLSDAFIIGGGELIDQCYVNHKAPFVHKPFPFKKRHDSDEVIDVHKIPQSKVTPHSIDPTRKPRNLTSFTNRQLNIIHASSRPDKNKKLAHEIVRQIQLHDKQHRYNLKFANKSSMLNTTAKEAFYNYSNLLNFPNDSLLTNTKSNGISDFSEKTMYKIINLDETNTSQDKSKSNHNYLINQVKVTGHVLNKKENNNNTRI